MVLFLVILIMDTNVQIVKCLAFNCYGYKNSCSLVENLCDDFDICFISEHWLKPCELDHIKRNLKERKLWSFLKSSIDPEIVQVGRSFGGVGFICKQLKSYKYQVIHISSDRLCAIQILQGQTVILTVVGVYMPFYNGNKEQISLYAETIDLLQDVIDTHAGYAPCIILGDFNASLPQNQQLHVYWHKHSPYNHNSVMLYDFVMNNDLTVSAGANVPYT